jgi:hypothetical protein
MANIAASRRSTRTVSIGRPKWLSRAVSQNDTLFKAHSANVPDEPQAILSIPDAFCIAVAHSCAQRAAVPIPPQMPIIHDGSLLFHSHTVAASVGLPPIIFATIDFPGSRKCALFDPVDKEPALGKNHSPSILTKVSR